MALWEYLWTWSWTTKGLYHLNWNANDSSWSWNNLTPSNISWVWWKIWSWSARFNWSSSYASNVSPIIPYWAKIISVLIKTTWTWVQYICWNSQVDSTKNWTFLWMNGWAVNFNVTDWSWTSTVEISWISTVNDWKWHLVTVTWDWTTWTDSAKLYIDWVLDVTDTPTKTTEPTADNWLYIWRQPIVANYYFDWDIDEIIIENRAWTTNEVKKHYTYQKGLFWII